MKSLCDFHVAMDSATLVGVVGLERYEESALLRSLAVRADARARGLGAALLQEVERRAIEHGVKELYALTLTAETYLVRRGYQVIAREAVPATILQTTEFASLCPDTATCFGKRLG